MSELVEGEPIASKGVPWSGNTWKPTVIGYQVGLTIKVFFISDSIERIEVKLLLILIKVWKKDTEFKLRKMFPLLTCSSASSDALADVLSYLDEIEITKRNTERYEVEVTQILRSHSQGESCF